MPKHSAETRQKIKDAWVKRRLTFIPPMKGKKMSAESRAKMSAAKKGKPQPCHLGVKHSPETRAIISQRTRERTPRGKNHPGWKHGNLERAKNDRRKPEYRVWRFAVFSRDKFKCQTCGDERGGNLRAHHVKPFATHPNLRYDVRNGITMCHRCHELEHYKPDSIRNMRKPKRGKPLWR